MYAHTFVSEDTPRWPPMVNTPRRSGRRPTHCAQPALDSRPLSAPAPLDRQRREDLPVHLQRLPAMRSRSRPARRARRLRRRRHQLLAAGAAVAILVSGCNIQIHSQPDPSIGDDTMLIAADKGTPMFERNFNPFLRNARTAATYIYEPLIMNNPLDGKLTPWLASDWNLPNPQTITMTIRDDVT